jgi:hypothetical protein
MRGEVWEIPEDIPKRHPFEYPDLTGAKSISGCGDMKNHLLLVRMWFIIA